jgi:hypothetical protein
MKNEFLAKQLQYSVTALALLNLCPTRALAQDSHAHMLTAQQHQLAMGQQNKASALIKVVRESTERFKDVSVAEREVIPCNSAASADPTQAPWGCIT